MPNNFALVKLDQASEKFYLIKINPRRTINDDLVSIGGGKYQMIFPYNISSVMANSTVLTKVTTVSNPNEYSFDESTNTLIIYSTPSTSNIIVVYYYLFYTGGRHRVISEDPENSSTTKRDWLPRIISNPTLVQSIENILEGVLSINISNLRIINDNHEFENYLTVNDSFYQSEIKIWLCLNNVENIQKIYDGKITNIRSDETIITLSFNDPLSSLQSPASCGDSTQYVYWTRNDYPNLNNTSNNTPIRFFFGSVSRYDLVSDSSITGITNARMLDHTTLYYAVCTNYSNVISTITNRVWGIGRSTDGWLDFGFTPSSIDNSGIDFTRLTGTAAEIAKFKIGDTFSCTQSGTYYLRVVDIDKINNYLYTTKEAAISTGVIVNGNLCPSLVLTNEFDEIYYLLYGRDYAATSVTTSGGNQYLYVTLVNNFEANHPPLTSLDPNRYKLKFRVRPDTTNHKHGDVVKFLLERSGLDVNAASIVSANNDLTTIANFSIPYFDQTDFNSYLKYLEDLLKSTLGYIALNNSFEIEYHLFSAPSSTDDITNVDVIKDSYSLEINYEDIVTQMIAYNLHYSSEETQQDIDPPNATYSSAKSKYLHGIDRTIRFVHLLESISSRLIDIFSIYSERRVKYKFDTKAINLDNILGTDILLTRQGILGNESSKELKIISISKNPKKTELIATDLYNI